MDVRGTLQTSLGDTYRITDELGGGGMSRVFAATDVSLGRDVVVKVLAPELSGAVNVERFQREIQLAARLQHAYIVPLLSAGVAGDLPYYTMPRIEGQSLRRRLEQSGELPVQDAARILRNVAEALAYAHERGIVHRDIKPDNVLLTPYHAVVTDFGVAKALDASAQSGGGLTSAGMALGTPAYMAPEQAAGDPATDHRADIYAFGVLAYEMLTGRTPFSARSPQAMLAAHAIERVEPISKLRPTTPQPLADLVMRCLEKRPADRPQSARGLLEAVETVASGATTAHAGSARPRRFGVPTITAAVVAVIAIVAAAWLFRPEPAAAREPRLVVVPFENLGRVTDDYFAEGLAEEIGNRLSRLRGVSVVARSSAARYRGSGKTAQEIGRELGADYVLAGTVRWATAPNGESRVRVTPELVQVSSGTQLWGDAHEAVVSEIFRVQSEIAQRVAEALGTRLVAGERSVLATAGTDNVEAHNAYLLGRYHWKRRTAADLRLAVQHFQRAVALDPNYARAHAGLADALALLPLYAPGDLEPRQATLLAEHAARRAIALDSMLAEAYAALAIVASRQYDTRRNVIYLRKALEIDPSYATAQQWYSEYFSDVGRFDQAIAHGKIAVELEPLVPVMQHALAGAYYRSGRVDEAERHWTRAIELNPEFPNAYVALALLHWLRGDRERAGRMLVEFARRTGLAPEVFEEFSRSVRDQKRAVAIVPRIPGSRLRAHLYALLGERELALAALQEALDRGEPLIEQVRTEPLWRSYHGEPRFQAVLDRVGMSDAKLREAGLL